MLVVSQLFCLSIEKAKLYKYAIFCHNSYVKHMSGNISENSLT